MRAENAERFTQLEEVWTAVADLTDELDEAAWDIPTDLPGWTVKDCLSHLVGTELGFLGEPPPAVDLSHLTHLKNPFSEIIEVWVEARRATPGRDVAAEWCAVFPRRLAALAAMSDDEWDVVGWSPLGDVAYRTFMEVRVFDSWMHQQDMRRAADRPGELDASGARVSVGRIRNGLGYIVGKRAGAPDATSVVFAVDGDAGGTFTVVVDGGRAIDVVDQVADPTVRLDLDVETFCALGGGRWSGPEAAAADRVRISGDADLGRRILDNMAITP